MASELTSEQQARIIRGCKRWAKNGHDKTNILRHLQKRLKKFAVNWARIARELDDL